MWNHSLHHYGTIGKPRLNDAIAFIFQQVRIKSMSIRSNCTQLTFALRLEKSRLLFLGPRTRQVFHSTKIATERGKTRVRNDNPHTRHSKLERASMIWLLLPPSRGRSTVTVHEIFNLNEIDSGLARQLLLTKSHFKCPLNSKSIKGYAVSCDASCRSPFLDLLVRR